MTKSVHVCIPVLKRYDMLRKALESLKRSSVIPEQCFIIDNGKMGARLLVAIDLLKLPFPVQVHEPGQPLGVAASWNWFVDHVPEERIIANDDVEFAQRSIERLVASDADLVWSKGCGFSCFVIRDTCIQKIGRFDEEISPGYGYYEDDDYLQRLDGRGTRAPSAAAATVDAGIVHHKSSTLAVNTEEEMMNHHRKFMIAQENYARKWNIPLSEFRQ